MSGDASGGYEAERKRRVVAATKLRAAELAARERNHEVSLRIEGSVQGMHLTLITYRAAPGQQRQFKTLEDVVWRAEGVSMDDIISWAIRALMRHAAVQLELPFEHQAETAE
jgi:hypothetical protein